MPLTRAFINCQLWTPPKHSVTVPSSTIILQPHFDAVGISGNRIDIIASKEEVLARCDGNTDVIDCKQAMLLPGFTDCHVHFLDSGIRLLSVKLRHCKNKVEFMDTMRAHMVDQPRGKWILGGDWDHQQWGGVLPDKTWIDEVSPNNPVWLNRSDGHMYLANSVALEMAGVNINTPDVEGGTVVRFENGEPTGVLKDNATNLVSRVIPRRTEEDERQALEAAMAYVAERGVTKVHTMITVDCCCGLWPVNMGRDADKQDVELAYQEVKLYERFARNCELKTRIRAALPVASWKRVITEGLGMKLSDARDDHISENFLSLQSARNEAFDSSGFLQVGALKAQMDGSLGSHTAAMYEDYIDTPGYKGSFIWEPSILQNHILNATQHGLPVCVHAIGDEANAVTLDVFREVEKNLADEVKNDVDFRFRIEHAQHLQSRDIERFAKLNVIASMQMSHLADDGRWAKQIIGEERMKTSWPMKSILKAGAVVALGSDWFVAEPNPLQGIYDAVTRQTYDGANPDGLVPSEKVTIEEALIGYTSAGAFAACEEEERGCLSPGYLADLVVVDRNLLDIDASDIMDVKVLMTVVNGNIIYRNPCLDL